MEKIITRKEATAIGLNFYFTGKPCKRGHIARRDVIYRGCIECRRLIWERQSEKRKKNGYHQAYDLTRTTPKKNKKMMGLQQHKRRLQVKNRRKMLRLATSRCDIDRLKRDEIYLQARRLTLETGVVHVVDHIVPIVSSKVCGLHVSHNLQIVTATENTKKGNKFEG